MQTDNCEVVIVGAGPAGLHAAKTLAQKGKQVTVFEQNKFVGEKLCANGLTAKDFRDFNLPPSIIEKEYTAAYICRGIQKLELTLDQPWLWTIDRRALARWQLGQARAAGAMVYLHTPITKVSKDYVTLGDGRNLKYRYLIGADGSNSIVRRFLKLSTHKLIVALQYHVPAHHFPNLEIYFQLRRFGPHYAWIFPHQDYTAVGTGADASLVPLQKLRRNFEKWCVKRGVNPREHTLHAHPINYDYQGIQFQNVFLVGDAAGLASGLTGEGIYPALVSGEEVAHKIIDPAYKMEKIDRLLATKYFEEKALRFYEKSKALTAVLFSLGFFWLKINKTFRRKLTRFLAER